jgi:hypothetical protein
MTANFLRQQAVTICKPYESLYEKLHSAGGCWLFKKAAAIKTAFLNII